MFSWVFLAAPVTLQLSALHQEFLLFLLCFDDCDCDHSLRAAINLTICLVQTHTAMWLTRTRKVSTASGHIWRILGPLCRCQKQSNLSCGKQKANKKQQQHQHSGSCLSPTEWVKPPRDFHGVKRPKGVRVGPW